MVYGRYIMIYLYLMDLNGVYKLITGVAQACTICGYTLGFYGCCYIYMHIHNYSQLIIEMVIAVIATDLSFLEMG